MDDPAVFSPLQTPKPKPQPQPNLRPSRCHLLRNPHVLPTVIKADLLRSVKLYVCLYIICMIVFGHIRHVYVNIRPSNLTSQK